MSHLLNIKPEGHDFAASDIAVDEVWQFEFIQFNRCIMEDKRKTEYWEIYSTSNFALLGTISWFGRWRRYAFRPNENTWWDEGCLRLISRMISGRMAARKGG
jgi:hypothetical protein